MRGWMATRTRGWLTWWHEGWPTKAHDGQGDVNESGRERGHPLCTPSHSLCSQLHHSLTLSLGGGAVNRFGEKAAEHLCEALRVNTTITQINLGSEC